MAFVPGSILTLGSGFVLNAAYGEQWKALVVGVAAVWIGATIGSILAFIIGRYLLSEFMEKWSQKYIIIAALSQAL